MSIRRGMPACVAAALILACFSPLGASRSRYGAQTWEPPKGKASEALAAAPQLPKASIFRAAAPAAQQQQQQQQQPHQEPEQHREAAKAMLLRMRPPDVARELAGPNVTSMSSVADDAPHPQLQRGPQLLKATQPEEDRGNNAVKDLLMDIGGGTGASVSGTGNTAMDQALLRRMRYQDKAVLLLLLLAYGGSLLFSASIAYRQAMNDSAVTFYADPRYHHLNTEGEDVETFLGVFNQPPQDCQLQVTGLLPLAPLPDYVVDAAVMWLGQRYRVAFSFALDLSPWLVPCAAELAPGGGGASAHDEDTAWAAGVPHEDIEKLRNYLENDRNELSYVELQKQVHWKDWEELATNIKSHIRQSGFTGHISVHRNSEDQVAVHKNKLWANFMHSRTTKVLLALSVLGWFIYQPYIWLRHYAISVRCKYRVDISIEQYWPLIVGKMGAEGFNSGIPADNLPGAAARAAALQGQRASQPRVGLAQWGH